MTRRLIDSCISQSEKFNALESHFDRLLWIMLLSHADPWGRGDAKPTGIKLRIIPGFTESHSDLLRAMENIHNIGLITIYGDDEHLYYEITKWEDFQSFNEKNRGKCSRFPSITEYHSDSQLITVYKLNEVKGSKDNIIKPPLRSSSGKNYVVDFDRTTGKFTNISESLMERWTKQFPGVNVLSKLSDLELWLMGEKPGRIKNYTSFITNCLKKEKPVNQWNDDPDDEITRDETGKIIKKYGLPYHEC